MSNSNQLVGYDEQQSSMMLENCILVDEFDRALGPISKFKAHKGDGNLHRAFSVLLFDENDQLLSHYIFGNKGQDYSHNYVRNYDEQEVYRTSENVFYMLNTSPTYWGKNPPEEQPEKEETTIDTTSSISPL